MPTSFDNTGRPAYMYDEVGDTWYAFGGKIDTAAAYEWTNTQTYLNNVTFEDAVIFKDGLNNFLNPAARDAAITSPVQGTIIFVRQDAGGNTINQIQYYSGSAWTANDGDISQITAGTGLSGGGTAGNITLSVDTTVVATTNNTLTMSGKTLTSPTINTPTISSPTVSGLYLSDSSVVFEGSGGDDANETTLTVTNPTADRTITLPNVSGTVITTGNLTDITSTGTLTSLTVEGTTNIQQVLEQTTVSATAATGTVNYNLLDNGAVTYYTSNATGNWTLNIRGSSSTSLDSIMSNGESMTIAFLVTNGGTAYYQTGFQIDGNSVTPKWQGGTAPSSGNINSIDIYSITVIKTASATFTALAAQTRFA